MKPFKSRFFALSAALMIAATFTSCGFFLNLANFQEQESKRTLFVFMS